VGRHIHLVAPRERGWTLSTWAFTTGTTGCPARAGMDPTVAGSAAPTLRLPRASGDGPAAGQERQPHRGVAPRERGWTVRLLCGRDRANGCPARAGMDPIITRETLSPIRLPRASGDGPGP